MPPFCAAKRQLLLEQVLALVVQIRRRALPIEGSPTGTVPNLWCNAHRIMEDAELACVVCSDLVTDCAASRTIFVIVLRASFVYA